MFAAKVARERAPRAVAPMGHREPVLAPAIAAGPTRATEAPSAFGYPANGPDRGPPLVGKKSDENGGPGVPGGLQQFNPTVPNTDTSGSPINMAFVEKPQKPEWDNGADESMAKRLDAVRHPSLAGLGVGLGFLRANTAMRFNRLIIGGHGNANVLATGSGDGPDTSDELNLKPGNQATWLPYFARDRFYGRADIWIYSCNVGSGPIPQLIADQSGSTVYAYTRTAWGNERAPWD
jgi:hypothetical protein